MPSIERDSSRDSERRLKHQHSSSSDGGRALVPMWDSSDPERAPPPLPMNPSSPGIASRPNTSSAIQSVHAALTEKARESAYVTNAIAKRIDSSPERSLIKGAAHKRMQSLQNGNVRDLSCFIEGGNGSGSPRSPDKSSARPGTPLTTKDFLLERSSERDTGRSATPTPSRDLSLQNTPTIRPSLRRPPQSILGENAPPQSATMLALQNMASRDADAPLANITNGSTALVRAPQTFEAISNQILSLTNIATSLQKEMAQLSRRSKDNATDLVSLKEATNARDEDIRRSLRELVTNLSDSGSRSSSNLYGGGPLYLEGKPHNSPGSRSIKPFSLPRIPSPNSFAASLDRESVTTPSAYGPEGGAAIIALLEKVLRDMGTKEGQNLLVARLGDIADRLSGEGISTAKRLEDLVQFIETNSNSRSLIASNGAGGVNGNSRNFSFNEPPRLGLESCPPRSGPMTARVEALLGTATNQENSRGLGASRAVDLVNEDILKIIRTVKDSVAQGGGLTAEVKALVRELRGEVLGMGREMGRKLDQAKAQNVLIKDARAEKEHLAQIVQDGLAELKQHMDRVLHENRRQSSSSSASRNTVDYEEIYNAMRSAISEDSRKQKPGLDKEDIIEAVKEAWENYKPDIELQHFGLEREELLACLKEGFQEYAPENNSREIGGATREEVFEAVVEGLKHFAPPRIEAEASLSREEILDAVRECLEEFEFPSAPPVAALEHDITREDMVNAVKEGLSTFDFPSRANAVSSDVNSHYSTDDIFEAVKSGIAEAPLALDRVGEEVLERLQEILASLRIDFKAVSDEAKQNVAAHGRDTEQVLDATKDGFEKLRGDIESYVDRAADVHGKNGILDSMQESFASLRVEMARLLSESSAQSLDSFKTELEHLRETMTSSVVRGSIGGDKDEFLDVFREGLESLRADIEKPRGSNESILSGTGEILDALHDGVTSLRAEVEKIGNKPVDMTVNYEILDTLKAGLEGLRADMDRIRGSGHGERAVAEITEGSMIPAEGLKRNDIENLEVLITQLRIKVEALESMPPPPPQPVPGSLSREDLAGVEEILRNVQESVGGMSSHDRPGAQDGVSREDMEAIETLLRNTKAKIDEMDPERVVKENLDSLETIVTETRLNLTELTTHLEDISKREDLSTVDSLVREILLGLEEMKERAQKDAEDVEKVTKTDIEAVEGLCLDVKSAIEQMIQSDIAALASKEDVRSLGEMVKEFKGRIEHHAEANATAFEERQAETVGVGERVLEIKTFLDDFRGIVNDKLDEGSTNIEALGKFLESVGETVGQNATITDDIKEMFDTMKTEFEKSNAGVVGSKLEADEKFQQTWDKFDSKMEEKFSELIAKYDEAQTSADIKSKLGEEKLAETEIAMLATKAVNEELKLLIDTLGSTLTESTEKMDEASKTVFGRVEDTFTRVEETHADAKSEHQLTREQVSKALGAIESVQSHVSDYHPKILDSIKDVLLIVGQHYEHSKSADATIQAKIAERPAPVPREETPLLQAAPVPGEKYDDAQVHEKLDKLVDHMHVAGKSFTQLDMLDKIHQQVMKTAAEVSEFVSVQTQRIADDHEDKEKALESASIALEKRLAQKDHVEATVVGLRKEEEHLKDSVAILKAEQEDLALQKMRLSADVSSLETALRLRREELQAMEARAEGLERRILEGVIDHSRALLLSKSSKGRDAMSRRRVPSHATSTTGSIASTATCRTSTTTSSAVTMAMGGSSRAMTSIPLNNLAGPAKRIFSLNHISNNIPTGTNFARSHSVKALGGAGTLRKSSWGGTLNNKYGDLNKENLALKESEEDESMSEGSVEDGGRTSHVRRSSVGTTILTSTGTGVTESIDEGTEWSGSMDGETPREEISEVVLYQGESEVA